jgi:hypothetical protein
MEDAVLAVNNINCSTTKTSLGKNGLAIIQPVRILSKHIVGPGCYGCCSFKVLEPCSASASILGLHIIRLYNQYFGARTTTQLKGRPVQPG